MLQSIAPALAAGFLVAASATAGTIVQEGSLTGGLGSSVQSIELDQFDTLGGTRTLDAVRIEALTSVIGGGETTTGGPDVHILAHLSADYLLGMTPLVQTDAIVDTIIQQNGPPISYTVFDGDSGEALLEPPADLSAWIGGGLITLTARVTFTVEEDPDGATNFGAGGSASYTVTYEFTDRTGACPADLDTDGNIGFTDLNQLLAAWGACAGCPEDLDGDDNVGFIDLNTLLASWGPCV